MKKTNIFFFAGLAIAALAAGGFAQSQTTSNKNNSQISLDEIEAMTACEVSSNANQNRGYCAPMYNSSSDACTQTGDPGSVRCSGNM